jgi:transposase-like protein
LALTSNHPTRDLNLFQVRLSRDYRNSEGFLAERSINVPYETIRPWVIWRATSFDWINVKTSHQWCATNDGADVRDVMVQS